MTVINATELQRVGMLIRSGRMADARRVCEGLLESNADPVVQALHGAICLQMGAPAEAEASLRAALKARPQDRTVRANLLEALSMLGRFEEAAQYCDRAVSLADQTMRLARLHAHVMQSLGRFEEAIDLYREIVAREPADWAAWNNLGNALAGIGRWEEGADALRRAAALQPASAPIQVNLAQVLIDAGQEQEAERLLCEVADRFPDDIEPFVRLYNLFTAQAREDAAYMALKDALDRRPNDHDLLKTFVHESIGRGAFSEAEQACDHTLSLEPTQSEAFACLAAIYDRSNQEQRLPALIERASAAGADDPTVNYLRALDYKRQGKIDESWDAFQRSQGVADDVRRWQLESQLQDARGNYDEAFAAAEAANAEWATDLSGPAERARFYREMVQVSTEILSPEWLGTWPRFEEPLDRPDPVFLVGFPRSGTTLLDTMLMGHSQTLVLEEEAYLATLELGIGGVTEWPNVPVPELRRLRAEYFGNIGRDHPLAPDSIVVDKHPLHLNKAEAIHRLFPRSKLILALRHPCDVVLSCFMTNFKLNNAMSNFLTLETTAQLYDLTFTHWEKARRLLDLDVAEVVYEELIEGPEQVLRPLADRINLPWEATIVDHTSTARRRAQVKTASYAQVTEQIYKRSAGKWRNYRRHLEPVLPILAPWVQKFGYEL